MLLPTVLPGNFILGFLLTWFAPQLAMWEKTRYMILVEESERMSKASSTLSFQNPQFLNPYFWETLKHLWPVVTKNIICGFPRTISVCCPTSSLEVAVYLSGPSICSLNLFTPYDIKHLSCQSLYSEVVVVSKIDMVSALLESKV